MLLSVLLVFTCLFGNGATDGNEYPIKAMFLLNFIKYVEWPSDKINQTITIGVIGDSEIFDALTALASKRSSEGQKVEIKKFDEKALATYQMIFISKSENKKIEEIIKKVSLKGILVISEDDKCKIRQAGINLFNQNDKIRFEINLPAVKNSGMKVSSKLIELSSSEKR